MFICVDLNFLAAVGFYFWVTHIRIKYMQFFYNFLKLILLSLEAIRNFYLRHKTFALFSGWFNANECVVVVHHAQCVHCAVTKTYVKTCLASHYCGKLYATTINHSFLQIKFTTIFYLNLPKINEMRQEQSINENTFGDFFRWLIYHLFGHTRRATR